jgi:hypothetical protein
MSAPKLATALHVPASESAERAVLGAILADADCFRRVAPLLAAEDFYADTHRAVFGAFAHLAAEHRAIDLLTTTDQLERSGTLGAAGGVAYVGSLADGLPDPGNIEHYAAIVRDASHRREVQRVGMELMEAAASAAQDISDLATRAAGTLGRIGADRSGRRLDALGLLDFMTAKAPPREPLALPWLHTRELVMVYGWRGGGKSYFLETLALAVASAGMAFGWRVPARRSVLLVDGELSVETLQRRLAAIGLGAELPVTADVPLRILAADGNEDGIPDLSTAEGQALIEQHLDGVDLLLLDNLAALCSTSKENEAESWQVMKAWLGRLRRQGKAVVFAHHAGKGGQQRGTSAREDTLDTVIALRRPCDYEPREGCRFELHFEKARSLAGADLDPFEARLDAGPNGGSAWTLRSLAARQLEQVVALAREGMSSREIASEIGGVSRATVSRRLMQAKREGLL